MGRKGIQPRDTVRAYIALKKQERAPTLLNLRLELGRGSYSTLQKHLQMLAFKEHKLLSVESKSDVNLSTD